MDKRVETKVVNLFGGPGAGKSTIAAAIYAELKTRRNLIEYVPEWVKPWSYSSRQIEWWEQMYITASQLQSEAQLYNKVPLIVTDSPWIIGAFYGTSPLLRRQLSEYLVNMRNGFECIGVSYLDYFVNRKDRFYIQEGRYETEEQARIKDRLMYSWLKDELGIKLQTIESTKEVLEDLNVRGR